MSGSIENAIAATIAPLIRQIETLTATVERLQQTVEDLTPANDRLWSYTQVAVKCEVEPSTVRSWVHLKKIKTVTVNGKTRVPDSEVKRLLMNANRP